MQPMCAKITSVLRHDYPGQACSLAKSLEVIGERWSLLIVRDVMTGNRAAQAGPWWFTDLSGFGQRAAGGMRGEHGTRERMT